jgi:hypothetical protein
MQSELAIDQNTLSDTAGAAHMNARRWWLLVLLATELGLLVRLVHVLGADFPLNDGGMFTVMVEDIRRHGYALPSTTSYNDAGIPFAYPPLAFYLAALCTDITGQPVTDVLRVLPLVFSTLTIPAFALLASVLMGERRAAAYAAIVFALVPRAFNWEIVGGGLTRAPGLLFALLALHQGAMLFLAGGQRWRVVPVIAFTALALLCHPEMGVFAGIGLVLFALWRERSRRHVTQLAAIAMGVGLCAAPWWLTVIVRHGLDPLLALTTAGGGPWLGLVRLGLLDVTDAPFGNLVAVLGVLGALVCIAERRLLLPAWLVILFILDPRKAPTLAAAPLSMLAAGFVVEELLPRLRGRMERTRRVLPSIVLGYGLCWLLLSALGAGLHERSPLHALLPEERDAMRWVAANTPAESRFLVISGRNAWLDAPSEWFPALAQRPSVATVQGFEWMGRDAYTRRVRAHRELRRCADGNLDCISGWEARYASGYTHIFIAVDDPAGAQAGTRPDRDCCATLRAALLRSSSYEIIYRGPGATIAVRR